MTIRWRKAMHAAWSGMRDFALTVLVFGSVQVLIGLFLWPVLFRTQLQGFSMALSLVGFAGWIMSFALSFGDRRRRRMQMLASPRTKGPVENLPLLGQMQEQVQHAGCGFTLLVSSLVPLAIAFVLRLQADLRSGLSLRDIFPPMP